MPLGIERINARRRQPNDRIVFIKPLEGPDRDLALDFLERIAAICNPVMKANHLAVMSLEEYEPNMEFVGRNFNAGEVVQLVLKAPYTGHWLPFRHVQMVMMHELAHCKQMNHSGAFWKVRNQYAGELRGLWTQDYTGEGFWSRGQTLLSGQYTTSTSPETEVMPRSLCGGTYRTSRRGKRKRKRKSASSNLSYAEKKQRRIEKKFGKQGQALGEAEEDRVKLEDGKKVKAKPRVAGSARGRELRAAAALARLDGNHGAESTQSESSSSGESDDDDLDVKKEAVDKYGNRLLDTKGRGLVRVCEGEDMKEDADAQREMAELEEVDRQPPAAGPQIKSEGDEDSAPTIAPSTVFLTQHNANEKHHLNKNSPEQRPVIKARKSDTVAASSTPNPGGSRSSPAQAHTPTRQCRVCSMENHPLAITCAACANVLDPENHPESWRCQSTTCKETSYVNAGDCGVCGVCGSRKQDAGQV